MNILWIKKVKNRKWSRYRPLKKYNIGQYQSIFYILPPIYCRPHWYIPYIWWRRRSTFNLIKKKSLILLIWVISFLYGRYISYRSIHINPWKYDMYDINTYAILYSKAIWSFTIYKYVQIIFKWLSFSLLLQLLKILMQKHWISTTWVEVGFYKLQHSRII